VELEERLTVMGEALFVAFPATSSSAMVRGPVADVLAVALKAVDVMTSFAPGPTVMVTPPVVAGVSPLLLATRVYPVPGLLREQVKVATPAVGVTGLAVQVRVPLAGLLLMASPIEADDVVTTLPALSSTDTPVVKLVPAVVVPTGCVVTMSFAGAPAVMLNAEVVVGLSPLAVAERV
jgi:hypothetical protein